MKLSNFISNLIQTGEVTIDAKMCLFEPKDLIEASVILQQYYHTDKLEMPANPPDFDPQAALWAAQYFYHATQLTLLRELGEDEIKKYLIPFAGEKNATSIYSVDLLFRYIPNLFNLAEGLSPEDVLVKYLNEIILKWPFSSVGILLKEEANISTILSHPSLRLTYIDRIIAQKDKKRTTNKEVFSLLNEALGNHQDTLWKNFN